MSAEEHGRRPRRLPVDVGSPLLFVVCAAIALGVFAMHEVRAAYRCDSDTSYCAESRDKVSVYQGVLRMRKGGPALPDHAFDVSFETRDSEGYGPVRFRSGGSGRYCYVWTIEAIEPPPVKVGGQGARLDEVAHQRREGRDQRRERERQGRQADDHQERRGRAQTRETRLRAVRLRGDLCRARLDSLAATFRLRLEPGSTLRATMDLHAGLP